MSIFCFFPSKPARSQTYILPQICNLFPTLVNKLTFYFTHLDSLIYVSTVLRVWMQNQFSEPRDCGKCSTEGTTTNALLRTGGTFTTHVIPSVCLVCSDLSEPTSHSSCLQDLFCDSLRILWHCLSLELEWKLTFSSPVATAEFSKFAGILSAALSQHQLSGFEIAQLEFHHLHQLYS